MPTLNLHLYDRFREEQIAGNNPVDFDTEDLYCMIVTAGYTLNQNTHDFRDDLGANEVSGAGYTAGGNICDNATVTMDGAGLVTVDFDDPAPWDQDEAGFDDGDRFIFYINRGGAASADPLVAYSDQMGGEGNANGELSVLLNTDGLFESPR